MFDCHLACFDVDKEVKIFPDYGNEYNKIYGYCRLPKRILTTAAILKRRFP